jgi:hypothetical protein
MEPVYLIAPIVPIGIAGALVYRWVYQRRLEEDRVAEEGMAIMLTEQWGAAFRLEPNERLRMCWRGQLYEGPATPEYDKSLEDPMAGRFIKPEMAVLYRKVQVHLALTTHDRLVVGRSGQRGADDLEVTPHSEWLPGSAIYFAYDLGLTPGRPVLMENGYRGRTYFCMLGNTPGIRLPMWIPEEAAAAISAWRVPLQT